MKKKLLYLIMVAAMLVFLFPVSAVAADGEGDVDGERPGSREGALASLEIPKSPTMLELVEPATVPIFGQPDQRISPIVSDDLYDTFSGYCDDDIWDVYVASDDTNLYFGVELGCLDWTYLYIGIDADQNPSTGYNTDADPWFFYWQPHSIGLDYMIEVSTYYGYADFYYIDPVGNWYYAGDLYLWLDYDYDWVETGVPLSYFTAVSGDSLPFDLVFSTWWGGLPEDEAPNTGYVTYSAGPPPIEPPTLTTGAATGETTNSATLHGNITDTGGENCGVRGFDWGETTSYGSFWTETDSFSTGDFSHLIDGLDANTTYHFRAKAHNSAGWSYGSDMQFTTEELLVLTVTTNPATGMTLTSATLNGTLASLGAYSSANVSFGWDDTPHSGDPTAYSNWTTAVNTSAEPFSADISGLTEDTQYYFCARATADGETVYGDELSFYTLGPDDWTFMVYLDGDNNLEDAAIDDFMEMSSVGSTADVNIVVQFDRVPGYTALYDNWTDAKRFYVEFCMTPTAANAVEDLGEVNMGSAATLVDFVLWTVTNYPADHYALVLWNHGSGWKLQENSNPLKGICWDDTSNDDYLTSPELAQALSIIYAETGAKLDIVGFDACLMGMAEIFYLIAPYADYGVASEEVEPNDGWPYDDILGHLIAGSPPGMAPDLLADTIVLDYMLSYGHPHAGIETMSAVSSATMGSVSSAVDVLAILLDDVAPEDFGSIFWARVATEETYYDPSYIDLYHFCQQLQAKFGAGDAYGIYNAAGAVITSVTNAISNFGNGDEHPNFHGMSIYFPSAVEEYWMNYGAVLDFTADTQWDEFLEWFYGQTVPEPEWRDLLTDPQGDQFAAFGPDIANVAGAVIGDPQVAFRVTAHAPLDYSDITSYMLIDADQDINTGWTDPDFPIGVDYAVLIESGYMGEALGKFPINPEGMDTRQGGISGYLVGDWDGTDFYYLASFPVFTEADYFWYGFPVSLLGEDVNCMDIIEALGTWSEMTDVAPDEDSWTFCLSPVELPDLVISAKSEAGPSPEEDTPYTVSFTVRNDGDATALAGHDVSLFIDGVEQAQTVEVTVDLAPGGSWPSSFPTPITLYGIRNTITVCADCNEEVDELNERNNCLTNVFPEATLADALAAGKVWLAAQQRADGSWGTWNQVAKTGLAVLKFETQAVEEEEIIPIDHTYTYYSQIVTGLDYILSNAHIADIGMQPAGNPDSDGDGHGVYFHSPGNDWAAIYETSIAVMAIAASTHPEWVVTGGPVDGWTYAEVVLNAVDYLAWAQTDFGWGRGGWDYEPQNSSGDRSDQSNTGYATLALSYAEAYTVGPPAHGFNLPIPGMVRTELEVWVDYIQNTSGGWEDGGSGYDNPDWPNILRTGNLLQQFAWLGDTVAESRVQAAIDYLVRHWSEPSEPGWRGDPASYQATFTTMKGLEALNIGLIDSIDWFQDFIDVLLAQQNLDGSWPVCVWDDGDQILATEWALLTLEKAVPEVIEKPDLVISEKGEQWVIEEETYTVSFVVRNRGNVSVVAQDHQVALYVDDQLIEQMAFPIDLAPGKTSAVGTFDTEITLSQKGWDEVAVCADSTDVVKDELNEDNNCRRNIWTLLTVEVGDATITACTTTSVDVWVRNFPEGDYGLGCYTININFDPNMLEIVDADPDTAGFQVSPGNVPFDSPVAALYSDYVSVTQYSTEMPGPSGDIKLFDLVFHCQRQGDTWLEPQIEVLADTNGDEIPAVCAPGLIKQIWMEADTDLGNAQDEDGLVTIPVSIDRLKDPSTGETVAEDIPIGAYEATAYYNPEGIVMLDLLGGDSPFGSPVVGLIYSDHVEFTDFDAYGSSAYPIIVARLVPSLIGPAGKTFVIDAPFDLIATPDGSVIPEQETVSKRFNRGDVNEDGTVNIIDAMKGAQHLVGIPEAADINFLNMASVHRDGPDGDVKNIIDCMFIAQYVVGILNDYFE